MSSLDAETLETVSRQRDVAEQAEAGLRLALHQAETANRTLQGERDAARREVSSLTATKNSLALALDSWIAGARQRDERIDALLGQLAEQSKKAQAVYAVREQAAERWLAERRALTAERNDLLAKFASLDATNNRLRIERDGARAEADALQARLNDVLATIQTGINAVFDDLTKPS